MIQKFILLLSLLILPWSALHAQESGLKIDQAREIFNQGVQQGLQGEYAASLESFNKAIKIHPIFAEAFLYAGIAHSELGNHTQAIKNFTITMELDQKFADQAFYFRGVSRAALLDFPGAVQDLTQAININPDYISFFQRGKANFSMAQYGKALQDFEIALRMKPRFDQGILYRGKALYHTGLLTEALDDLNTTVTTSPNNAEGFYYRGLVYKALKNERSARENFELAGRINPDLKYQIEGQKQVQPVVILSEGTTYEQPPQVQNPVDNRQMATAASEPILIETATTLLQVGYYDHLLNPSKGLKGFGIQVASYSGTESLARLSRAYMERYEQPVFIQVSRASDRTLYKIIIGELGQRQQAELLRNQLRGTDFPDCFIISY